MLSPGMGEDDPLAGFLDHLDYPPLIGEGKSTMEGGASFLLGNPGKGGKEKFVSRFIGYFFPPIAGGVNPGLSRKGSDTKTRVIG